MKYKHILLTISLFLIALISVTAQEKGKKGFDIEQFKQQKAEFIIKEVGLTDAEAKAFIPLTNELMDKRFELNHSARKDAREVRLKKDKSNADYERLIDTGFDIRAKELQLDKEYYQKFRKILSPEKIYKYQKAENKFMRNMVGGNRGKSRAE